MSNKECAEMIYKAMKKEVVSLIESHLDRVMVEATKKMRPKLVCDDCGTMEEVYHRHGGLVKCESCLEAYHKVRV